MDKKQTKIEHKAPIPIYYASKLNYAEIADIIRVKFFDMVEVMPEVLGADLTLDDVDLDRFGSYLEIEYETDVIHAFMGSEFGQGILFGAYIGYLKDLSIKEEVEALEAME